MEKEKKKFEKFVDDICLMVLMVDANAMWDASYLCMPMASLETAAVGTVK